MAVFWRMPLEKPPGDGPGLARQADRRQRVIDAVLAATGQVQEVAEVLARAQVLVQRHVFRHVGQPATGGQGIVPQVDAAHGNPSRRRGDKAQQGVDGGGFAGAVAAQQGVDFPARKRSDRPCSSRAITGDDVVGFNYVLHEFSFKYGFAGRA
jgi:hypothetical protein